MATPPRPAANVDLFDTYFRRADLDRDGRISGNEAVAFFQASGLPKNVLAQIWTYADQNRIGFLGRAEFYNALKLVTVAQSKRELTSELVKVALFGPASAKIPAPQINLSVVPAQQPVAGAALVTSHAGANVQPVPPTSGVRGPVPQLLPTSNASSQNAPSPGNSVIRPNQVPLGSSAPQSRGMGPGGVTGPSSSVRPMLGVGPQPANQGSAFIGMQVGVPPPGAAARPPRPSGSSVPIQQQVPNRSFRPPNVTGTTSQANAPWPKLSQSDVQKYTRVFVDVDTDRDGKIGGNQARDLFLSWRLPREILKQVWDLSDQDNDSMLSLKEFCIALYLMERYREGRPLPHALPDNILVDFSTIAQPTPGYNSGMLKPTPGRQQQPGKPGPGAPDRPSTGPRQPLPDLAPPSNDETQSNQQKSRVPLLEKHLVDQLSKEEQEALNSKFQEATESEKKVEELEKEITESRQKIEFYRAKMQELVLYKSRCDNHINEIIERASSGKQEVELLSKKYEEKYKQMGDVASKLTIEEATFRDIQEKKMELYKAIVKLEQDGGAGGVTQGHTDRIQKEIDELVKSLNERCKKYGLRARPASLLELPFGWQPGIQEDVADWDEDWDKFEDEGFTFVKELTLDVKNVIAPPKTKSTSIPKEVTAAGSVSPSADNNQLDKSPKKDKETLENGIEHQKNEDDIAGNAPNSPAAEALNESPVKKSTDPHFDKNESQHASPRFDKPESMPKGGDSSTSGDRKHDEPKWGRFDASDVADSLWGFNGDTATKENDHENHVETDTGNQHANYFFDSGDFNLNPIKTGSKQTEWNLPPKSTFAFDESVPSTPLKTSFAFDESVPSTPLTGGNGYSFDKFSRFDSFNMSDGGLFKPPETPSTIDFGQREFSRFDSFSSTSDFDQGHSRRSSTDFDRVKDFSRFDSMNSSSSNFDTGRDFYNFNTASSTGNFDNGKDLSRFDSMRSNYDPGQGAFSRFDSMKSTKDFDPTHGFPSFDDSDPFSSTGPFKSSFASETPRSEYNSWGVSETPRRDSNTWGVGVSETPRRDSDSWSVSDPFASTGGPFSTSFDGETPRRTSFDDGETPRKTSFDSETPRSTNWSAF